MAPGITGFGERTKALPSLIHFPGLYPKSQVETAVYVGRQGPKTIIPWGPCDDGQTFGNPEPVELVPEANLEQQQDVVSVKLIDLAYGRSGDKGDVSNIGNHLIFFYIFLSSLYKKVQRK
jgi:hypothetical protein